jgi:transposase-like protein
MAPIDDALAACEAENSPNYTHIAKEHDVDRTTLSRRHRGKTGSKASGRDQTAFLTTQQEKELVRYINGLTEDGLPPTNSMVATFASRIAKKQPGKMWVSRFIKRHSDELKSAYLEGLDLSRKRADNIYLINHYFELVNLTPL